ncbi:MAG: hypothetical protein E5299_01180 [Burkholderia gladioli]|nr:MAG: hypothetical protein E5299_01180 [Burkholderia gladioli]
MASTGIISGDMNGLRTSAVRHVVDYAEALLHKSSEIH